MRSSKQLTKLVLVVEDMPGSRWLVEQLLEKAGFRTSSVENGAEALAYLESCAPPAAIVLDLSMPVMNGWEFLHRQMEDDELAAIPVVLHSGDPFVSQSKLEGTNVVAFVPKTDTTTHLVAAVKEAVERRQAS